MIDNNDKKLDQGRMFVIEIAMVIIVLIISVYLSVVVYSSQNTFEKTYNETKSQISALEEKVNVLNEEVVALEDTGSGENITGSGGIVSDIADIKEKLDLYKEHIKSLTDFQDEMKQFKKNLLEKDSTTGSSEVSKEDFDNLKKQVIDLSIKVGSLGTGTGTTN